MTGSNFAAHLPRHQSIGVRFAMFGTVALLIAALGGCGPSEPSDTSVGGAMARQWCPASAMTDCTAAVKAAADAGKPAALCVYPDNKWEITTPSAQDTTGSPCGATGAGTTKGVIVPTNL